MTPAQIEAVKNSRAKVAPIADQASILFYDRLFTLGHDLIKGIPESARG